MTNKNTLKKLLMYLVVLVGVLFVGFMSFYFAVNNETIALTIKEGDVIYMNEGDVIRLPVEHLDAHRDTKLNPVSSDNEVAYYSEAANTIIATKGGVATFTVSPTNTKFGPFKFDVLVGDGSVDNPWYVSTASQFAKIGKTVTEGKPWTVYQNYELLNDINLIENWSPINVFYGTFAGEGHKISNLKINSAETVVGLIQTLAVGARFENVTLSNVSVTATNTEATAVGVVAGINKGFIGKIKLDGTLASASETASVGTFAGQNIYEGSRAIISTVEAQINIKANGLIGGIAGKNIGGIIHNAIADVQSLNVFSQEDPSTLDAPLDEESPEVYFGGIVGHNSAIVYGTDSVFRQAAIKNVVARTNATALLQTDAEYLANIALVAYEDVEIGNNVHTYAVKNVFENVKVQAISDVNPFVSQNGAVTSSILMITSSQYTNADTYAGLSSVWSFDATTRKPTINMGISYESPSISDPGNRILNGSEFVNAIVTITSSMQKEISYTIDASSATNNEIVVDANDIMTARGLTTWTPIGTKIQPYKGKLIVENGYLVIENLTIDSNLSYLGFFGVISGANTEIKNIKFRNVNITSNKGLAGVLAGEIERGYISNIYIDNATIRNAQIAGFLAGQIAYAVAENIFVGASFVEEHVNLLTNQTANDIYYGGITGILGGIINNAEINDAVIEQGKETGTVMGGIVGKMLTVTNVKNVYNNSAALNSLSGKGYYGGVVGFMNSYAVVDMSYSMGTILNIIGTETESYAGGVAAYIGEDSVVSRSFSDSLSIKNKNIGGIAALNYGTIRESYSLGEYNGQNVGGLTFKNAGQIIHTYTRASLYSSGNNSSYTVAGLTVEFPEGGSMEYIFSSALLQAPYGAQKFAETRVSFRRSWAERLLHGEQPGGILVNYILINFGDAKIQNSFFNTWGRFPKEFVQTDETSVKGMGSSNPFEQVGFFNYSPQIWKFTEGEWPQLANVVVANIEE